MRYNERLLHEALQGNKDSFKELKFNAGSGDAEAQYYFAQYYAKDSEEDFRYWIKKAIVDNHYFAKLEGQAIHEKEQEQESMKFSEAVKTCLNKYTTFTGRASRSEYWWFAFFYFLVFMLLAIITVVFVRDETSYFIVTALSVCTTLALILPGIAVGVRRLHDVGKSGWWMLVSFIPYIGSFILLYFMCKESAADNEFGKRPDK